MTSDRNIQRISLVHALTAVSRAKSQKTLVKHLVEILAVITDFKNVHDSLHSMLSTTQANLNILSHQFTTLQSQQIDRILDELDFFLQKQKVPINISANFKFETYVANSIQFSSITDENRLKTILEKIRSYEDEVFRVKKFRDDLQLASSRGHRAGLSELAMNLSKSIQQALQHADDLIFLSLPFSDQIARKLR